MLTGFDKNERSFYFLVTGKHVRGNPDPSPENRFRDGVSGNPLGRPSYKRLREEIAKLRDDGTSDWERTYNHLVEVATKWEVEIRGENLEVASARDSVRAIELLWAYGLGKPRVGPTIELPEGDHAGKSTFELVMDAYRERLLAGEMTGEELGALMKILVTIETAKAETARVAERDKWTLFLKSMGPRLYAITAENLEAAMRAYEADPRKFLGRSDGGAAVIEAAVAAEAKAPEGQP